MRTRFNDFVDRHDVAWELSMALLAVVYVAIGFALDEPTVTAGPTLQWVETGLTVLFALEFGSRFAAATDRERYLRGHWIDLVALIPPRGDCGSPDSCASFASSARSPACIGRSGT